MNTRVPLMVREYWSQVTRSVRPSDVEKTPQTHPRMAVTRSPNLILQNKRYRTE